LTADGGFAILVAKPGTSGENGIAVTLWPDGVGNAPEQGAGSSSAGATGVEMAGQREAVIRRRMLLVEEDRHAIDELRDVFTANGYECEVALDMATARAILGDRMMDLAVVKSPLSGLRDEELVQELKAHDPQMSVVIYKGAADKTRQRRLRRLGADGYLSKASDNRAVARTVARVMVARK